MTEERKSIDLASLVGPHELSGVDTDVIQVKNYADYEEPCDVLRFILDGVTYEAIEDPSDGYRSSMEGCYVTGAAVKNKFAPVRVIASHRTKGDHNDTDDVLELRDADNGKVILEVGTRNVDDYYPCFVGSWHPGEMAINA